MKPGDIVDVTVTYLEMRARPAVGIAPAPMTRGLSLLRLEEPPLSFWRYLYGTVGAEHDWTDKLKWSDEDLAAFVQDPQVELNVAYLTGWPAGFYQLDFRDGMTCDLSYFGLMPEAIGRGLGRWLLTTAIHSAWDRDITRLTVNTCTLDHPQALPLYQRVGFTPLERQTYKRKIGVGAVEE